MVYTVLFLLCVVYFACCETSFFDRIMTVTAYNSIDSLPTPDIIKRANYPCEIHHVVTEDGFILTVHRIPGNNTHGVNKALAPIILQHGLMASSADWVLKPKSDLAFQLADRGYDVWLSNSRGNVYSRAHTSLSPDNDEFWNWTWHEMGYYDIPAVVDYILDKTKHKQLQYIGHSMGTTMFFVMCSTRPEYNDKISYMAALAPVAFLANTESPVKYLAPLAGDLEKITDFFGHGELALNGIAKKLLQIACDMTTIQTEICENIMFLIVGFDSEQLDLKLLPLIMGHNPAGTSSKTIVHYAQEIRSRKFCQYDHGEEQNLVIYNSTTPPEYNLTEISAPMSLHYATNDLLATPEDVKHLYQNLHDKVKMFKVNYEKFNHLDFLWGRNVTFLLYNRIFHLLSKTHPAFRTIGDSHHNQDRKFFDFNILLQEKAENEKVEEKKAPPKKEEKTISKGQNKSIFADIEEKLPGWQSTIVNKLVSLQKFLVKKIGGKK